MLLSHMPAAVNTYAYDAVTVEELDLSDSDSEDEYPAPAAQRGQGSRVSGNGSTTWPQDITAGPISFGRSRVPASPAPGMWARTPDAGPSQYPDQGLGSWDSLVPAPFVSFIKFWGGGFRAGRGRQAQEHLGSVRVAPDQVRMLPQPAHGMRYVKAHWCSTSMPSSKF